MTQAQHESANFHRIADVAIAILGVLRKSERTGGYSSQRQLREWLGETIKFSTADVEPALSLLEAAGLLERPPAALGQPRPGRLKSDAEASAGLPADIHLARAVVEVSRGSNGRGPRVTKEQIAERLEAADVDISAEDLDNVLLRLLDCGQLVGVRAASGAPLRYAVSARWPFNEIDVLEADICRVLRGRDELGYEDEDELRRWLSAAEPPVIYTEAEFNLAMGHLTLIGRIQTPRPAEWFRSGPRLTWLVDAPIAIQEN